MLGSDHRRHRSGRHLVRRNRNRGRQDNTHLRLSFNDRRAVQGATRSRRHHINRRKSRKRRRTQDSNRGRIMHNGTVVTRHQFSGVLTVNGGSLMRTLNPTRALLPKYLRHRKLLIGRLHEHVASTSTIGNTRHNRLGVLNRHVRLPTIRTLGGANKSRMTQAQSNTEHLASVTHIIRGTHLTRMPDNIDYQSPQTTGILKITVTHSRVRTLIGNIVRLKSMVTKSGIVNVRSGMTLGHIKVLIRGTIGAGIRSPTLALTNRIITLVGSNTHLTHRLHHIINTNVNSRRSLSGLKQVVLILSKTGRINGRNLLVVHHSGRDVTVRFFNLKEHSLTAGDTGSGRSRLMRGTSHRRHSSGLVRSRSKYINLWGNRRTNSRRHIAWAVMCLATNLPDSEGRLVLTELQRSQTTRQFHHQRQYSRTDTKPNHRRPQRSPAMTHHNARYTPLSQSNQVQHTEGRKVT